METIASVQKSKLKWVWSVLFSPSSKAKPIEADEEYSDLAYDELNPLLAKQLGEMAEERERLNREVSAIKKAFADNVLGA